MMVRTGARGRIIALQWWRGAGVGRNWTEWDGMTFTMSVRTLKRAAHGLPVACAATKFECCLISALCLPFQSVNSS
jgi:hypothetical protein